MKTMKTLTGEARRGAIGDGPWLDEPDRVEFRAHGLPCILNRVLNAKGGGGHWCGYVGVPPGHPWHGQRLDDAGLDGPDIDVHGGITYAEPCAGEICHVPEPGESDDVWWLGFDACHAGDLQPSTRKLLRDLGHEDPSPFVRRADVYRDVEYMRAETEALAAQAARAANAPSFTPPLASWSSEDLQRMVKETGPLIAASSLGRAVEEMAADPEAHLAALERELDELPAAFFDEATAPDVTRQQLDAVAHVLGRPDDPPDPDKDE